MLLRRLTLSFLALFLLSGCSVSLFEVKYVVPAKAPRATQPGTGGPGAPTLVEISRQETINGTKLWQLNAIVGEAIQGLSADNCVQAAELLNGDVVVDFGNIACPEGDALMPAENIQFTMFQEQGEQSDGCHLDFALMLDSEQLGAGNINLCNSTPKVTDLCTNDFASKCELVLKSNQFYLILPK